MYNWGVLTEKISEVDMEDYRKINKWFEIHWKTVLTLIVGIIPILAYKSAVRFAIDKAISANNIFTGIIAYCGIIISFWGIYWKTTREENLKRIEKIEKERLEVFGIYSLFRYTLNKNKELYKYKFTGDGFIQKLYHSREQKGNSWFYLLDDEMVKSETKLIVSQGQKAYCLIELHNEMKDFNNKVDYYKNEINTENIKKKCRLYMANQCNENVFFELVINEMEIVELLLQVDSKINEQRFLKSKELMEKFLGKKYMDLETQYFDVFKENFNYMYKLINIADRISLLKAVIIRATDNEILTEDNLEHLEIFELLDKYVRKLFVFMNISNRIIERFDEVEAFLIQSTKQQDS